MDFLYIYLLTILPGFGVLFGVTGTIGLIGSFIASLFMIPFGISVKSREHPDADDVTAYAMLKRIIPIFVIISLPLAFLGILIPSTEEMKIIVGGYYVTNIEGISDLPPNIVNLMNHFVEQMGPAAVSE